MSTGYTEEHLHSIMDGGWKGVRGVDAYLVSSPVESSWSPRVVTFLRSLGIR